MFNKHFSRHGVVKHDLLLNMCSNSDDDCVENTSSLKLSKDYGTPKFQSPFAPEESLVRALWPLLGAAIARSGHSHEDIDQTFGCLARWPFALEPTDLH